MKLRRVLMGLLLGGLVIQSAHADPLDRWERRQERREQRLENHLSNALPAEGRGIGPGEAARMAQAQNGGGRVLDVVQVSGGWRVKLIKAGEVRAVFISENAR